MGISKGRLRWGPGSCCCPVSPGVHAPRRLGVKGAAESGTIAAPAVIASAIEDALQPLGVRIRNLPITPERLVALIRAAR